MNAAAILSALLLTFPHHGQQAQRMSAGIHRPHECYLVLSVAPRGAMPKLYGEFRKLKPALELERVLEDNGIPAQIGEKECER